MIDAAYAQSEEVSVSIWDRWRNLDRLVHTWSEESKYCTMSRKGDGHRSLGFTRCGLHWLTGLYYVELLGQFDAKLQKNGEEKVPSPQSNGSNGATNCCPVHCILQNWPRATYFRRMSRMSSHYRHRGLLCRPKENVFFRRAKEDYVEQ